MGTGMKEYKSPEWLSTEFIENSLRSFFKNENPQVLSVDSFDASVKGLSFASVIHRVIAEVKRDDLVENFHLIIKVHPKGRAGIVAHKNRLFQREICVYTELLPKVNELLDLIDDNTQISPTYYLTPYGDPDVLLMLDDMKAKNFVMIEKSRLLNLEQVLPVIQKIAKLHACSAVVASKDPEIMRPYLEGTISSNPERQDFLKFFPANLKCLADEVIQWSGYEEIASKLYALEKTIIPRAVDMFENVSTNFRVFNMGDLWVNNLMFQFNEDLVPEDVILLDYQLSYYGSPAIDLNYLLFGSLNENVRKVHFKFIIHEYHRYLQDVLVRLNYKGYIPKLRDIHIEIIRNSLQAVIASVCLTPLILMDTERFTELEGLFDRSERSDSFRKANIQNPRYKTFIQRTLKEFELSGFLD